MSIRSPWFEFLIHLHISYKPRCLNCIEEKTCSLSPILCVRVGSRSATLSPRWLLKTVFKVHTSLDIYFPFSDQGLFCKVPNILMKSVTLYHFLSCLQYQLFKSPILLTNPCWKWSMDISWYQNFDIEFNCWGKEGRPTFATYLLINLMLLSLTNYMYVLVLQTICLYFCTCLQIITLENLIVTFSCLLTIPDENTTLIRPTAKWPTLGVLKNSSNLCSKFLSAQILF